MPVGTDAGVEESKDNMYFLTRSSKPPVGKLGANSMHEMLNYAKGHKELEFVTSKSISG
jgi:hypothetical protein